MLSNKTKGLGIFTLAMFITGSIDSIRNLPAAAMFGNDLIFFFILATIVFLLPTALVSAELSSVYTERSGIYNWVKEAFGEKTGVFAIWLQWINTMVWYPTILSFTAGTAAFLVDPMLVEKKAYLVSMILGTFWLLTLLNLRGIKTSVHFASICAIIGMIIPMVLILLLAILWVLLKHPLQLHLSLSTIIPTFNHTESWISLTAIVTSFLGMELATVHVQHVGAPQKTFPKALMISVVIIVLTMLLGSLSIALVLPHDQINLVDGVMQEFESFLNVYHLHNAIFLLAGMLLIGSMGGMINWIISPAKGLLLAAEDGYLPPFFVKENRFNVPYRLLLTQAALVSVICLVFLLMPSVNGSYWLLADLSTQLYVLMYVLMFLAMIYLRYKNPDVNRPFMIPGGEVGMWIVCLLGLVGCAIALTVGFFPPKGINVGTAFHYELLFSGGMAMMILPVFLLYFYKKRVV